MYGSKEWREKGQDYLRMAQEISDRELSDQYADLAQRYIEMADKIEDKSLVAGASLSEDSNDASSN
jgi:hypothetical protein